MNTPHSLRPPRRRFACILIACLAAAAIGLRLDAAGAPALALDATPGADNTAAFQAALDKGAGALFVPAGDWRIGTVRIPADVTLTFDPRARLIPIPEKITDQNLLVVTGDHVRIEGIHYDFAWENAATKTAPARHPVTAASVIVGHLIYADSVNDLTVTGAHVENSTPRAVIPLEKRARRGRLLNPDGTDPGTKGHYRYTDYFLGETLLKAVDSEHITLENSTATCIQNMLASTRCGDVSVHGNRMISGNVMTGFSEGGKSLRHYDNWSRDVKYQATWFGGSPDPSRKPYLPRGSSTVALRDVKPGMPGYNRHTSGAFDIIISHNYAEYGNTLCWGNKGRQVVIDGNIARFMADYSYGSEGGENVVFSNNISINATSGAIVSMYWGEKLLITGNQVIIRHEPWSPEWSWWDSEAKYLGPFVRLHHGPYDKDNLYGAGTVQISGNLFVSELAQRPTQLSIQDGRDVTVSGNKFVNGWINKFGPGRLTVLNNEFVSRLPGDGPAVSVKGRASVAIVKGNVIRRESSTITDTDETQKADEAKAVPYFFAADNDAPAEADTGDGKAGGAAISLRPSGAFFGLVQDNVVYGWKQALSATFVKNRSPLSLLVTGNTTDGTLDTDKPDGAPNIRITNNTPLPSGLMPR